MLAQAYANIKYSLPCDDCGGDGGIQVPIHREEYIDDDGRYYYTYDFDIEQCQFCWENQSSTFNGGTKGMFDVSGIVHNNIAQTVCSPVSVKFDEVNTTSFNNLEDMHGKRIAIFDAVKSESVKQQGEHHLMYDFLDQGRCIGKYIFNKNGDKHPIDLTNFQYLYFPAYILREDAELHVDLHLSVG